MYCPVCFLYGGYIKSLRMICWLHRYHVQTCLPLFYRIAYHDGACLSGFSRFQFEIIKNCSACQKDNVPQPEYTINPGDIMIKFTAPEDRVIRVTDKVTDKEREILTLLTEDPGYTMSQLAEQLGISRKTVAVRLKKLKESGLIKRVGSDRKGYWELPK